MYTDFILFLSHYNLQCLDIQATVILTSLNINFELPLFFIFYLINYEVVQASLVSFIRTYELLRGLLVSIIRNYELLHALLVSFIHSYELPRTQSQSLIGA